MQIVNAFFLLGLIVVATTGTVGVYMHTL